MKKFMLGTLLAGTFLLSGCTVVDDLATDLESDTTGLKRTVTIYSKDGKILKQYKGKNVRTKYDANGGTRITINIDGKRIQAINSDVIIEEDGSEHFYTKSEE